MKVATCRHPRSPGVPDGPRVLSGVKIGFRDHSSEVDLGQRRTLLETLGLLLPCTGGLYFFPLNSVCKCWVDWCDHHREVSQSLLPKPAVRDGP